MAKIKIKNGLYWFFTENGQWELVQVKNKFFCKVHEKPARWVSLKTVKDKQNKFRFAVESGSVKVW